MRWIYWLGWNLFGSAYRSLFGLKVVGREHLVTEGAVLIAANHESFLDPPLVGTLYKDEMFYLARKTLMSGPLLKWIYLAWNSIPVDQDRPDMTSLKTIIKLLSNGRRVLIFPEGERSLDGTFGPAQPGVGLIAVKSNVVIQPIRIRGAREALPRGSGRVRFSQISLHIGPPIRLTEAELTTAKGKHGYQQITDRIWDAVKAL
ncbi:1-acyl-sn-glycerol-3-phosphate acyltransferase [Luteolibacter flavescens]|uniref:1-acyl-sn-glycerol-3-phosphate acyltransferase n=1 Tax=Luteolibacter flavescens TaxID=1859460 RepID=A0ABT3FKC2_9BACT|nr:lysophospholipid acyltransferase family protein [Luteolibacter flavescens]MCW1883731.1 1-acyl-sn-glycerol-3-phosphate acyltransferase [Luteolibacter flavescens]